MVTFLAADATNCQLYLHRTNTASSATAYNILSKTAIYCSAFVNENVNPHATLDSWLAQVHCPDKARPIRMPNTKLLPETTKDAAQRVQTTAVRQRPACRESPQLSFAVYLQILRLFVPEDAARRQSKRWTVI